MKLTYRPEIDGLRAIAAVAVILYHAQITIFGYQLFKGGFIGVDIFFVISGYIITSIILKELVTTGSFSFKYFYERRIRRILPALLFVMLVSLPFAWMCLLPESFIDFSKSILYSLGFSSNFYFWYFGDEYGAVSGRLKPLLHTWSLSIEEQYYILFPIVLVVTFKYFRKYLIHILILGFIVSLALADWGSRNHPHFNFYVLPTRGWELLAGSILAYFENILGHRSKYKKLNLILPGFGFFLIGHSILFFNDKMFHPSIYTLSPILGASLIIWFSHKDEHITKILSTKLFVGIGLISYSLYLWHYPVFAFDKIIEFTQGSLFYKLLLGVIIVILSIVSYYFIERPSRNKNIEFKIILSLIVISISVLIFFNFNNILKDGYKDRLPEILQKNLLVSKNLNLLENPDGKICNDNIQGCRFNTASNKKVFIIGDSHMGSLIFNLKDKVVKENYQFITSTHGGCLYFPGFNRILIKTQNIDTICNDNYFKKLKQTLLIEKNSIIIYGGRTPLYLSNYSFNNQEGGVEGNEWAYKFISSGKYENIQSSFKNEIFEISKNNKIILIYPIPEVGWNVPSKLLNSLPKRVDLKKKYLIPKNFITTSYKVYKERTKSSFELFDSIDVKNIYRVYPHTLFCDTTIKNRCLTHDDKNIFYFDDNHPSLKGAEMINDLIMKEIEKIELKSK
jgi:peptidoglycan/LPS O-acetylase OafA/YrhL